MKRRKTWLYILFAGIFIPATFLLAFFVWVYIPAPCDCHPQEFQHIRVDAGDQYFCQDSWLRHNKSGLWELYLKGDAFERGVIKGVLTKELIYEQEAAFVKQIEELVPSRFYRNFLKYFIAWFNRRADHYIPEEYLQEIYGVSASASEEFKYIGPAYLRFLNYHAAHDLGHAVQNMGMVGCSSFALWDDAAEDSLLIIGRNFDFFVNEDFAKNKIIAFYEPEKGYRMMFITWGGMVGVVSGMNEKGLTITLNAGRSGIPGAAKTPVSILAREILQYAQNIEEATAIAKKRETFVSESFLIGSAQDRKAVILEKSTDRLEVYASPGNTLVCANHFQSEGFSVDKLNMKAIENGTSTYRQQRLEELLDTKKPINPAKAAAVLRDKKGLQGRNIGLGNEKSINQLIAHHSIIFVPERRMVYISTHDFQLGEYIAYDLNKIFKHHSDGQGWEEDNLQNQNIPADSFLFSPDYLNYIEFKKISQAFEQGSQGEKPVINEAFIDHFISLNPESYYGYYLAGNHYFEERKYQLAHKYYETALRKEVGSNAEIEKIQSKMTTCMTRDSAK